MTESKAPKVKCPNKKCRRLNSIKSIRFTTDDMMHFKCEHCGLKIEQVSGYETHWRTE